MKTIKLRAIIVYLLALAFFGGLLFFFISMLKQADEWALQPINGHLSGEELAHAGKILDRNGEILAYSENEKRLYAQDAGVRTAILHTVGDGSVNITTSIQNQFLPELFGYQLITGLGAPSFLNTTKDIHLTLDSEICQIASEALGAYKGTVVVYNHKTGEILCQVSKPTYDPYNPPDFSAGDERYAGAYLNRSISSSFTPGSVFKIITSAAAIENIDDLYERTFYCPGNITVNGEKITCMEHHGAINFEDGMAKSCNIVFANLAMELGAEKMTQQAEKMGFNKAFSLDGASTLPSAYDVSGATEADLGWSGIGQYNDLVNPLHMLRIMGAIANDGVPVEPRRVDSIYSSFDKKSEKNKAVLGERLLTQDTAQKLQQVMRYTMRSQYGDSMFKGLTVCAKTGTAEIGDSKLPHAWMVGFSTDEDCPLAFVVVVEESGFGYRKAGPIASRVMAALAGKLRG